MPTSFIYGRIDVLADIPKFLEQTRHGNNLANGRRLLQVKKKINNIWRNVCKFL